MAVQIIKDDPNVWRASSDSSKYVIEIDRNICIGAATCVAIASNIFALDEQNKAVFLDKEWDGDDLLLAAAQSCPVLAITLKDKSSGMVIFPTV